MWNDSPNGILNTVIEKVRRALNKSEQWRSSLINIIYKPSMYIEKKAGESTVPCVVPFLKLNCVDDILLY